MRRSPLHSSWLLLSVLLVLAASLSLWMGCGERATPPTGPESLQQSQTTLSKANPQIRAAMAIQNRHTPELMAVRGVLGTATGLSDSGAPAVVVLAATAVPDGAVPIALEGTPVVVKITGPISALSQGNGKGNGKGGKPGGNNVDPTSRFARPVPIGVSTGNEGECSAGTIGCRVIVGSNVYALSNNHVFALENDAPKGSIVLQPGRYDTSCLLDPNDELGTLWDFEPINFSASASNTIDAATALSSTSDLDNATPSDGYGVPKQAVVAAAVNMKVQKYGRTTSLTKGTITGINATINIGYTNGTARFVDQIIVESRKPVIKAGDSGSLLVSDPDRNPVGLLFAGSRDGKFAIANRIDLVLSRFNASIDGE